MTAASAMFRHVTGLAAVKAMSGREREWPHLESLEVHHDMSYREDGRDKCRFSTESNKLRRDPLTGIGAMRKAALKTIRGFKSSQKRP